MGFSIETLLENYEFRTIREGEVEGNRWMHLVVEDDFSCDQSRISVPANLRGVVSTMGLQKGDHIDVRVRVTASEKYNRLTLIKVLRVVDADGEVTEF